MRSRTIFLAVATLAIVGSAGAFVAERPGDGPKLEAAAVAAPPIVNRLPDAHPVDADYAVPGVLDYRSWKPEYDAAPRAAPGTVYHAALRGSRTVRHSEEAIPSAPLESGGDVTANAAAPVPDAPEVKPAAANPQAE